MVIPALFQSEDDPFLLADDFDDQISDLQESPEEAETELPELQNPLTPLQKEVSLSAYLARYWHASHWLNRLAWWRIKYQSEINTGLLQNQTSTRLLCLKGEGIPLDSWPKILRANRIKNFIDAAGFMLLDVGAIIITPLLLHDLISYVSFPKERCGTSLPNVLVGISSNQITWLNHFGSDVIHEAAYWTWLGVILIPPTLGLSAAFLGQQQLRVLERASVIDNLEAALSNLNKETLTFRDAWFSLFPMSRLSKTLTQVKCMLLWDGRKDDTQSLFISAHFKAALVNSLIELTDSNYFLIRYRAMRLLAQVASSFHPENLDRFIDDPVHKADLTELRETILVALRKAPINDATTDQALFVLEAACAQALPFEEMENAALLEDHQRGGMARYFRWTLGDDVRPLTQLFWVPSILIAAYKIYSVSLYVKLIVNKLIDISYYFNDKSVCENKGNYFKFLKLSERYECIACDWPFVSYQNSLRAQTCLENLLQQKLIPKELGHYLSELPVVRGITQIDFSQQDWPNWSVADWEKILLGLESMIISPLEVFNASGRIVENPEEIQKLAPTQQHLHAIGQLLTQINVTQFDISHQDLNDELFPLLLDPLADQALSALYLIDTNMSDISANYFSALMANGGFNLSDLHLANNQIGDRGITAISEVLFNHTSLQVLNVGGNLFTDLGLQKLGLAIQQSFVHSLDLSAQSFSVNGLRLFSEAVTGNSSLNRLKLNNIGLTHDHLIALQNCLQNVESLDISDNELEDMDIPFILKQARQAGWKELNIANNLFDRELGQLLAKGLPTTALHYLDLSNNHLDGEFAPLANALPHSQLLNLVCEDCDLNDQDMAELASIFSKERLLLQSLNLNKNKMSDQTLLNWLETLPKSSLRELHLNNNKILTSNQSALALAQALTQTNLTVLDLSSNELDEHFFNELAPLLHQSALQRLNLSNNKLPKTSLKHFSEALVQLPCHRQDLNAAQLSRQEKRVFYPMKSNTLLNSLDIANTDPDATSLRGFCRVAASLPHVQFLEPNHLQRLNWQSCDVLAANSNGFRLEQTSNQTQSVRPAALIMGSPFLISLLCAGGIFCIIALLYGTYRASRSTYRFFRPEPPIDRSESEGNRPHRYLQHSSP